VLVRYDDTRNSDLEVVRICATPPPRTDDAIELTQLRRHRLRGPLERRRPSSPARRSDHASRRLGCGESPLLARIDALAIAEGPPSQQNPNTSYGDEAHESAYHALADLTREAVLAGFGLEVTGGDAR
jgi:hypothetical protein